MDSDTIQHRLLSALLAHVPFDGWSSHALEQARIDSGLREIDVLRAFPNGAADAVEAFMSHLDEAMLAALAALPLDSMKLSQKVEAAILLRLTAAEPHREAVRKAVAYYALPHHADKSLRRLYRTTDAIWRAVGDHPTDFSFYTKRLSLAGIYSTTLLFWLDDYSESHSETRAFLQRRMADLFRFHQFKQRLRKPFDSLKSAFA
jgi:ubiquinone biosynthesis protein COQ9